VKLTQKVALQSEMLARWQDAQARFDRVFGKERSIEIRQMLAFIAHRNSQWLFERASKVNKIVPRSVSSKVIKMDFSARKAFVWTQ
jgi:hypothetical protein